ncbi:MAG: hypothetical protein VX353_07870 [Actinomycetota bacterium]
MMKKFFREKNITRFDIEACAIGAAFLWVGIYHFLNQGFFEAIVPTWFPYPTFANLASGGAEIILGLGLITKRYRHYSAWALLLLLVIVYPANIDMFINDVDTQKNAAGIVERVVDADGVRLRNFIRLPFQFVFAWLVWRHTKTRPMQTN